MKRGIVCMLCLILGFYAMAGNKKVRKLPAQEQTVPSSADGEYILQSLSDGSKLKQGDYSESRISIKEHALTATVGCNGIHGSFNRSGNTITAMKLNMTEKYCEEYDMMERQFTETLNKIDSMGFRKRTLDFYSRRNKVMVLKRNEP